MPSTDISLIAIYTDITGHYTNSTSQNVVIQKVTEYTEVTFEGTTFSPITTASSPNFIGNNGNVIIDYGDGTVSVSNNYNHTYSTNGEHTIKIYNANALNNSCFQEVTGITDIILSNQITSINAQAFFGCSNLESIDLGSSLISIGDACFDTCSFESINIPNTVTTIGDYCFGRPNDLPFLKEIILNWDDSSDIVYYNSTWIYGVDGFEHFLIPQGTASLYTAKGYPSNKLVEDATYTNAVVSADKPILSYADGDKATLYAQLVDSQGQPVGASDVSIDFIRVDATTGVFIEILGNARTDATGKATLTNGYTSQGIGDIGIQCSGRGFVTESFVVHDYLWVPQLDGTETIHQVQGTTTISNGEMYGGSGYIGAFDNSNNWELSFDGKLTGDNCGLWLIKSDETSRDTNDVLLIRGNTYTHINGSATAHGNVGTVLSANTYHSFKYTKNGNNLTIVVDNTYTKTIQWSLLSTLSTLAIGVDSWGGTATIKNIVVKPL